MITSINIKNIASFDDVRGVEINDLKKVNFFFGFNGSGKSTIAKYLQNLSLDPSDQNAEFSSCSSVGYNRNQHEILTFNDEFIDENFQRNDELKGVFSLNKSNTTIDNQIKVEETKIQTYKVEKSKYEQRIESLSKDENEKFESLLTYCWNQRSTYTTFTKLTLAHPGSRPNHLQKIRSILDDSPDQQLSISELTSRYQSLYEKDLTEIKVNINVSDYKELRMLDVELEKLLQEVIVGNEDVDIATLINSLDSKSWVEEGLKYLGKSKETCPFCQQQTIDKSLIEQFKKLFDETYQSKIAELKSLRDKYKSKSDNFLSQLSNIQDVFNPSNQVSNLILNLRTLFDDNISAVNYKISHPNEKKFIKTLYHAKPVLSSIMFGIKNNNQLFAASDAKKKEIIEEIWKYIASNCKDEIKNFDDRKSKYDRIKILANALITRINEKINRSTQDIETLRSQTVNTKDAVENINSILKNSGFEGFEIDEKEIVNNISRYYLKRPNMSVSTSVFKTLSEGEKNFISFLYFYQRCLGTDDLQNNGLKKKIIIIDDPVSSLDSQSLFIVSTLIHNLILRKSDNPKSDKKLFKNDNIAQVYIFTHNIYFYREVSFKRRPLCTDYWHYKISKLNNKTHITGDADGNVYDDYSLMWKTIKEIKTKITQSPLNNIMISNTMRRIIESYVNFMGYGKDSWSALLNEDINEPTYYIKSAFISTINDESHGVKTMDSLYYQKIINEQPQVLFDVFSSIFKTIGKEHYELMMDEQLS